MMIKPPNKKQLFRGATGAIVLLGVVVLILLFSAPGCGDDDNQDTVDPSDALFDQINKILNTIVDPTTTAL